MRAAGGRTKDAEPAAAVLTSQEAEVARIVGGGATNRETAAALWLSVKTVERHLTSIYRKLGIRSRAELARWTDARDPTRGQD